VADSRAAADGAGGNAYLKEQIMRYNRIILALLALIFAVWVASAQEQSSNQRVFESPDAAVKAIVAACESNNTNELVAIFGPLFAVEAERVDDAEQRANRTRIAEMAKQVLRIEERSDSERVLLLGRELWPFPMPIVSEGAGWRFDTEAGLAELLRRRVGRNELTAIDVCHEFVRAQHEYARPNHDGDGILEYAQRILSTPGKRDGLYWEVKPASSDALSPFGPFLAAADASVRSGESDGYMGYRFRVLKGQGKHAPGGKTSYMQEDNMTQGFALLAWPVDYGHSGVMTFVVNHLGAVYQKDLGPKTESAATRIKRFDPDPSWKLVTPGG